MFHWVKSMWNWATTPTEIVFELSLYGLGNPWVPKIILVPKSINGKRWVKSFRLSALDMEDTVSCEPIRLVHPLSQYESNGFVLSRKIRSLCRARTLQLYIKAAIFAINIKTESSSLAISMSLTYWMSMAVMAFWPWKVQQSQKLAPNKLWIILIFSNQNWTCYNR